MKESFNDLYTRLYRENFEELEALREKQKKRSIKIGIFIALALICWVFIPFITIPLVIIAIIVASKINTKRINENKVIVTKRDLSYTEVFKAKVVKPIIENMFENAQYNPNQGLSSHEYIMGGYKERYDRYSSEDLVLASFNAEERDNIVIKFSEVHTERESKDKDGHTQYSTVFRGLAGNFILSKDIQTKMYIRSNGRGSWFGKNNRVKMDMPEFEKLFDVESEDDIMAMRILTADIMAEMIELYQKYKYTFEISIINDTVHMRLRTGGVFEPNVFKSSMEYKTVERYYTVLNALINIAKHIHDTIAKIEV